MSVMVSLPQLVEAWEEVARAADFTDGPMSASASTSNLQAGGAPSGLERPVASAPVLSNGGGSLLVPNGSCANGDVDAKRLVFYYFFSFNSYRVRLRFHGTFSSASSVS